MHDPKKCDLCREQPKHPGAIIPGDLGPALEVCLDCRRYEIAVEGVNAINNQWASSQTGFELSMKPMGRKACLVTKSFA